MGERLRKRSKLNVICNPLPRRALGCDPLQSGLNFIRNDGVTGLESCLRHNFPTRTSPIEC